MKPHVLVCRRMFPEVVARLREHFEVETNDADEPWSRAELIRRLQGQGRRVRHQLASRWTPSCSPPVRT